VLGEHVIRDIREGFVAAGANSVSNAPFYLALSGYRRTGCFLGHKSRMRFLVQLGL